MVAARLRFTDYVFLRKNGVFQPPTPIVANQDSDDCPCAGAQGEPPVDCDSTTTCVNRCTTGISLGDVNRDGAVDVAACYRDARPRLFVNDGAGGFCEDQVLPFPRGESQDPLWEPCCTNPRTRQVIVYRNVGYDPDCDGDLGRRGQSDVPAESRISTWATPATTT